MPRKRIIAAAPKNGWAHAKLVAACHEAGHFIATKHFGIDRSCCIRNIGNQMVGTWLFTGQTRYLSTSGLIESVIGWAGPLAERMNGKPPQRWKAESKVVWEMYETHELTKSDTDLINRHPMKRKTFDIAFAILSDRFTEVKSVAETLFKQDTLVSDP